MRLLIIGTLKGQLSAATKIAVDRGAAVTHATDTDQALKVLRARGADLLMVDVALDIRDLADRLAAEHFSAPIVACGIDNDARAAVAAIHAGAKEYIPLPPDPELIAAVLAAVTDDAPRSRLSRRGDGGDRQARGPDRGLRGLDPDHRRIRHRQGNGRALRSPAKRARQQSPSFRSIAPRFPRTCSNPNCSATRRAPSPARSRAGSASSRKRTAARCCWTKFPRWTRGCKRSSCAHCRSASSTASAAASRCRSISASSRPRTAISRTK